MAEYDGTIELASPPVGNMLIPNGATTVDHTMMAEEVAAASALLRPSFDGIYAPVLGWSLRTVAYTATGNEIVSCDATSAAFTVKLPNAPADKTRVTIKKIDVSANAVTVACQGTDVLNKAGGSTSASLTLTNQAVTMQYQAGGIWTVIGDDLPLSSLDTRYLQTSSTRVTHRPMVGPTGNAAVDAAAIQAAHDSLPAAGGLILLDAGVYDITNGITLSKPVKFQGLGGLHDGAHITKLTSSSLTGNAISVTTAGVRLDGFLLLQTGASSRTVTDGVLNSTTTVTSATASFTSSDVGRIISGTGIPAGATIAAVNSATSVTISAAATSTASGVTLSITKAPSAGAGLNNAQATRMRISDVGVTGFYDNIRMADGSEWIMDGVMSKGAVRYLGYGACPSAPDSGDQVIANSWFIGQTYDSAAGFRYESGGGLKVTNTKFNWHGSTPGKFLYAFDMALSATSSDLIMTGCSFENARSHLVNIGQLGASTATFQNIVLVGNQWAPYSSDPSVNCVRIAPANGSQPFSNIRIDGTFLGNGTGVAAAAVYLANVADARVDGQTSGYARFLDQG